MKENRRSAPAIGALEFIQIRVLHAMWIERSVLRAAERLRITSSAISHNLGKVRRLLDDELFLRRDGSMHPTSRMAEMAPLIREIVERIELLVDPMPFAAASSTRRFTLAALPYVAAFHLPAILQEMVTEAPDMQLRLITGGNSLVSDLEERRVDVAIGAFGTLSPSLARRQFREDRFVLALAADHPVLKGGSALPDLAQLAYVDVEIRIASDELVDIYYGHGGLRRRLNLDWAALHAIGLDHVDALIPQIVVPDSVTALELVARSQMAAIIIAPAAHHYALRGAIVCLPLPESFPKLQIELAYDRKSMADPAITWLIDRIAETTTP